MEIRLIPADPANGHNLSLFATPGEFAFNDNALYKDVTLGIAKTMVIENPEAGAYFISVFGEDTVETATGVYGTYYTGNNDVLNGVPYSIVVSFK